MKKITVLILLSSSSFHENHKLDFVESSNLLGYDLCAELARDKENFVFSPFSIYTVLAMTLKGADSNTKKEMEMVRHLKNSDKIQKSYYNTYATEINQSFLTANAVWIDNTFLINNDYKKLIESNFLSKIENADFENSYLKEKDEINQWVSQKTNNIIKDLLPTSALNQDIRLVLCNALYFNENWKIPFDEKKTITNKFYTGEKTVETLFMNTQFRGIYYEDNDVQITLLSYENPYYNLYIILPKENVKLEDIEKYITEGFLSAIFSSSQVKINLSLPKFSLSSKASLKNIMMKLGMKDAFNEIKANFSKMTYGPNPFID